MTVRPSAIPLRPDYNRIPPRTHFVRAAFALAQSHVNGAHDPEKYITGAQPEIALRIIERSDQNLLSTTASHAADDIVQDAWRDFISDLAPYSGAARLIAKAVPAKVNDIDQAFYPVRAAGPALPAWVAEGGAIPVRSVTFSNVTIGPAKKQAHMLVWSRELGKKSDARNIFETMLREDVAAGIDAAFFTTAAASSSANAGLLNGLTAGTGYGGGDRAAIDNDLTSLAESVATGGSGNVTFIMAPERLAKLRIKAADLVRDLDIAASAAVASDRIIAADAAALLVSVDPTPEIEASNDATIHMSDVPLEIVSGTGPTTADPVRNLFQTGSTALRVIHELALAKRRATAVAYLDGASW